MLGALLACVATSARSSLARGLDVVVEVEPTLEPALDARATRRLVTLELRDIEIPAAFVQKGSKASPPALYFRLLGKQATNVRVELWQLGELHDARTVSVGDGTPAHLLARRIALAAAELARHLRQQRLLQLHKQKKQLEELRRLGLQAAHSTREGPLALRTEAAFLWGERLWLSGPRLTAELSLRRSFRLDWGVRQGLGADHSGRSGLSSYEITLGPALRLHPSPQFDLDLGAEAAVAVVRINRARSVDATPDERTSWTARAGVALRLQPRLKRGLRASIALEGGSQLRAIPVRYDTGTERYGGFYAALALGIVFTPR